MTRLNKLVCRGNRPIQKRKEGKTHSKTGTKPLIFPFYPKFIKFQADSHPNFGKNLKKVKKFFVPRESLRLRKTPRTNCPEKIFTRRNSKSALRSPGASVARKPPAGAGTGPPCSERPASRMRCASPRATRFSGRKRPPDAHFCG